MLLVRWGAYPKKKDSWVPEVAVRKALLLVPPPSAAPLGGADVQPWSGRLGHSKRRKVEVSADSEAEWSVFRDYFLVGGSIQYELRHGWQTSRTLTGRVRCGVASFCPPAAYERMLGNAGVLRVNGDKRHHTFAKAADVPSILVAEWGKEWEVRVLATDYHQEQADGTLKRLFLAGSPACHCSYVNDPRGSDMRANVQIYCQFLTIPSHNEEKTDSNPPLGTCMELQIIEPVDAGDELFFGYGHKFFQEEDEEDEEEDEEGVGGH
jgi:hypothetical protein